MPPRASHRGVPASPAFGRHPVLVTSRARPPFDLNLGTPLWSSPAPRARLGAPFRPEAAPQRKRFARPPRAAQRLGDG